MNKIFVAVAYGGQYEDAWESNLAASEDVTKVEAFIAEEKARREKEGQFQLALHKFYNEFREANPVTRVALPRKERPKWKAGIAEKDITPEMRQERRDIDSFNMEQIRKQNAAENVWQNEVWRPAYENFCWEHDRGPGDFMMYTSTGKSYIDETYFRIDEIAKL